MKTILAQNMARNASFRKVINNKSPTPEGCTDVESLHYPFISTEINISTSPICFDVTDTAFFIFGESIIIEGFGNNGYVIGPVQNAWGATTGIFKVTAPKLTTATLLMSSSIEFPENEDENDEENPLVENHRQILIMKRHYTGKIASSFFYFNKENIQLNIQHLNILYPNITMKIKPDKKSLFSYDFIYDQFFSGEATKEQIFKAHYISGYMAPYKQNSTFMQMTGEFTVNIPNDNKYFPNKVVELIPNTIYSASTKDYTGLNVLSDGSIAAIIISVIVVVGCWIFSFVWFVILKKKCPKLKPSNKSEDRESTNNETNSHIMEPLL